MRQFYVYILASKSRVLYVGVTNDLRRRLGEHRTADTGFAARYRTRRLVYFEVTANPLAAIAREKELKGWTRQRKIALVATANRGWVDLSREWYASG